VKATAKKRVEADVQSALAWLKRHSTRAALEGMARYAIASDKALGVAMKDIKALGKKLGRNHELAAALWDTGVYEARMAASFVDDPAQVTAEQMDRWCRSFDNWAFCDALSFNLFDRTPHAIWSLTVHDKRAGNEPFLQGLTIIEREADDERHFVKKAVNMALRAIGKRNPTLHAAAVDVATRLAA
jgi:3-methyladenine DNA glycosylase AlkD